MILIGQTLVLQVNATAADLGGTERFVADGFATPEQCSHLINMCQVSQDRYSALVVLHVAKLGISITWISQRAV